MASFIDKIVTAQKMNIAPSGGATTGKFFAGGSVPVSTAKFVPVAPVQPSMQKFTLGGLAINVPSMGAMPFTPSADARLMAPGSGDGGAGTGTGEFVPETTMETTTGFDWKWILIGVVAIIALFFVLRKK